MSALADRCLNTAAVLLGLALFSSAGYGQPAVGLTAQTVKVSPSFLTPGDYQKMLALGQRLYVTGKERVTYMGTLTLPGNSGVPARVILQLPNLLRVDINGQTGQPLIYDGSNLTPGFAMQTDAGTLLQMFFEDSAESYLIERSKGMGRRLVGPVTNIFDDLDAPQEVMACEPSQATYPRQFGVVEPTPKKYCFDINTNRLAYSFSLVPTGGQQLHRTTVFRTWTQVSGNYYPFRIVVRDNGVVTYQFNATNAMVSAQASDGVFPGQ